MTPAVAILEASEIEFTLHTFRSAARHNYAEVAANQLGVPQARLYKTLIAQTDRKTLIVGLVSADCELNLKRLAQLAGAKRAHMADPKVAERASGYVTGAISPIAQRSKLATYIDERAALQETILVSAGRRGIQLELAPADLVHLCDALCGNIGDERGFRQ